MKHDWKIEAKCFSFFEFGWSARKKKALVMLWVTERKIPDKENWSWKWGNDKCHWKKAWYGTAAPTAALFKPFIPPKKQICLIYSWLHSFCVRGDSKEFYFKHRSWQYLELNPWSLAKRQLHTTTRPRIKQVLFLTPLWIHLGLDFKYYKYEGIFSIV